MKVTLGGDRLGSGNKNKIALNNYERSTHNLSQRWTSSMQCGALYPFLVLPAMRGDKFTIDLEAAARTIPTQGPLFGSFKMQLDIFQCPIRLYQAILHNNPTDIGLKMAQVKFPQIAIRSANNKTDKLDGMKFANNSLMKYLGVSGIGNASTLIGYAERKFNAIPVCAYYDIFKTYYSNKQEENAYVIGPKKISNEIYCTEFKISNKADMSPERTYEADHSITITTENADDWGNSVLFKVIYNKPIKNVNEVIKKTQFSLYAYGGNIDQAGIEEINEAVEQYASISNFITPVGYNKEENWVSYMLKIESLVETTEAQAEITINVDTIEQTWDEELQLNAFKLKNIDDFRMEILSHHTLGTSFKIGNGETYDWNEESGADGTGLPYSIICDKDVNGYSYSQQKMNGLVVKTYQSDLFNSWVNTEWIDGENGIAAITAISTAGDEFKIDALNLAEKLYNMLNRIAVAGGTYEAWQDAVYMENPNRHMESPVYLGGMSSEVVFEEIVQTAPAGDSETGSKLGTLGGRGVLVKRKGGNVSVKCSEASFIIGIVSLTPRIQQTQGNEFYMTELESMDDLHKPALDGIGFQNLMGERLAWFDTLIAGNVVAHRNVIGKVPAWIEYMTAVDKAYGDFADDSENGAGFMILNRNYEFDSEHGTIADATTYIDPAKYNYAFAYKNLDSQNFWVQIQCNIKARRLMSAKQIPNI